MRTSESNNSTGGILCHYSKKGLLLRNISKTDC